MNEWVMIAVMVWCMALFAIGGTGFKWARRYVLPVGLGLLGAFLTSWWQGLGFAITLCAFLCMGYGERASWWYRILIFTGYGTASLWFGWSWWLIITPLGCAAMFYFSNLKLTASSFTWKIPESGMGFLISAGYISAILNQWRTQ